MMYRDSTERVLLLGLGKASELNRKRYMKALTASIKSLNDGHAIEAVWVCATLR